MSAYLNEGGSSSGSGGSPYLQKGGTVGGSPYLQGSGGHRTSKPKKHRGFFSRVGHYAAGKTELAATDLKNIPGGIVQVVKVPVHEAKATYYLATGNKKAAEKELNAGHNESKTLVHGTVASTKQTVRHPLTDPFQTALLASALFSGGATTAARAGEAAAAAREGASFGDIVKAAASKPPVKARFLTINGEQVPLQPSKNPGVRAVQGAHDKVVQRAIDSNPDGRVASYGTKRAGGSLDETARYRSRLRDIPAQMLERSAAKLVRKGKLGSRRINEAALELTSVNTTPEQAVAYHLGQADKGVEPVRNRAVAALYQKVADQKLLTQNGDGDVIVNAADHPRLAQADVRLAELQKRGDVTLARYGIRSREALQTRVNAPAQVRAGGHYRSGAVPESAREGLRLEAEGQLSLAPRTEAERVGAGIVGGEPTRPGRGFVSYKAETPKAPKNPAARSAGPVVGVPKSPVGAQSFTGASLEQAQVPKNITGQAAQHYRQIVRFTNTHDRRMQAIRFGSKTRQTSRDVLVKVPGETHDQIPAAVNEILGRSHVTTDTIEGLRAALDEFKQDLVPGLRDKFTSNRQASIGTPAPEGHVWVDRNLLGDLAHQPIGPRGKIARSFDNINSAVTAATVYFKVGHVGTRVLTNASTNIIQGSAAPAEIARSVRLWHALSDEDRMRALAAAGQHGFQAMPHEGASVASKVAGKGANWWAKHADAPFRFNSIAYEARKAGFDTPEKFRQLLDHAEDPGSHGLSAAQASKVDWVLKRANREGIAYDRLGEFEKRYLTRGVWFYPWVKGTASYAVNTALEHPYKAAVGGQAGQIGREEQQRTLGDTPSYERGLFELAGGHRPLVADFSTFSPFATPADVGDVASVGQASSFLNPVYAALLQLATRQNQYGEHTNTPLTSAAGSLFAPTPEAQILTAFLRRHQNQSQRMFNTTWQSALERALVGPGMPRRVNPSALAKAAARERSGR